MEDQRKSREEFRRSWLTTMPEWAVAGGVSLAVGLAAQRFGLQGGWERPALTGLPLIWAGGRTLQWLCHTWTVTADGRLVVRKGVLFPTRQVIQLCSVSQVAADDPPATRWLDVGHIAFEAIDQHGQRRPFRWTWMNDHDRLCEIIRARGQLPIGRPAWWQTVREVVKQQIRTALGPLARILGQADRQDYGRFMAFCHHVLRTEQGGRWPPVGIPSATVGCWIAVLRQARVVASASNERGWRVVPAIASLDDIHRRIGPYELQRAVQRLARFQLRWRWAV